ncbi:hypothetical protein TRICHSKD4_3018 [Roseibium sp. TrichSKD4]|uniref:hypothetical protein n=1 Tax=Roseibium sp. TrichSKD4 TaxID=744980 RepID=UPI0001E56A87|nr:hypothetical protein [Roseibium sp. TrichSKD4]EFO31923.1 hypothetical protein TRICHSKD4_3018 [Roseibium sp. TrichSKD4]
MIVDEPSKLEPGIGTISPSDFEVGIEQFLRDPFPYKATNMLVDAIIEEFAKRTGAIVRQHSPVTRRIDVNNVGGTVSDFLQQVAVASGMSWWHDGATYHFELNSEFTSELVETSGYPADRLVSQIGKLGIVSRPFPFRQSSDGELLYVAGPPKFVEITAELARRLVALRLRRGQGENIRILPKIYVGGPRAEQRVNNSE